MSFLYWNWTEIIHFYKIIMNIQNNYLQNKLFIVKWSSVYIIAANKLNGDEINGKNDGTKI